VAQTLKTYYVQNGIRAQLPNNLRQIHWSLYLLLFWASIASILSRKREKERTHQKAIRARKEKVKTQSNNEINIDVTRINSEIVSRLVTQNRNRVWQCDEIQGWTTL